MKIRALLAGALVAGALAPVTAPPRPACAAESPRAVLVVDTGSSVQRLCVSLPDDAVSGLELVAAAGNQHGLDYAFGYGGQAVCRLRGVGSATEECFEDDYPYFWAYWRGNGAGGWTWSSSGPANTVVTDGDVEGWAWGEGTGPGTHPAPPGATFASVCPPQSDGEPKPPGGSGRADRHDPRPSVRPERRGDPGTTQHPSNAAPVMAASRDRPGTRRQHKGALKKPTADEGRARSDRIAGVEPPAVSGPEPDGPPAVTPTAERGPPAVGVAALAGALLLSALGAVVLRRRRRGA
jgi:hypothetical protein